MAVEWCMKAEIVVMEKLNGYRRKLWIQEATVIAKTLQEAIVHGIGPCIIIVQVGLAIVAHHQLM